MTGQTGTASATYRADTNTASLVRAATNVDMGVVPMSLGGAWTMRNAQAGSTSCTATVAAASIETSCGSSSISIPGVASGLPTRLSATRMSKASSIFGELGGVWRFTHGAETGSRWSCQATLVDSTVALDCQYGNNGRNYGVTATLSGSTLSGTATDGTEFSAQKR